IAIEIRRPDIEKSTLPCRTKGTHFGIKRCSILSTQMDIDGSQNDGWILTRSKTGNENPGIFFGLSWLAISNDETVTQKRPIIHLLALSCKLSIKLKTVTWNVQRRLGLNYGRA